MLYPTSRIFPFFRPLPTKNMPFRLSMIRMSSSLGPPAKEDTNKWHVNNRYAVSLHDGRLCTGCEGEGNQA